MDWQKELEERKNTYRAMRKGAEEYNEEQQRKPLGREIAYMDGSFGVDIEQEQEFQHELHGIVDDMKVKLVDETKILEGTLNPEYGKEEWEMPYIEPKNELSKSIPTEEQWKNESQSGCSTTDPTLISTTESNSSVCIAELFNRGCPMVQSDDMSTQSSTDSCSGRLDDCGIEIDATNESSECTVPMTSELMPGMPNEGRW